MMSPMRIAIGLVLSGVLLAAQNADPPEAHVAIAKNAAGDSYQNLFNFLCSTPAPRAGGAGARGAGRPAGAGPARGAPPGRGRAAGPPDRSTWYVEPVKVFDNLYFVGQSEYAAWAITTSDGIILIDTLFDYSVEDAVVGGLKKLGLDPAAIRYTVVTHPHPDHHGGAPLLQERYRTRVLMSAADWNVIDTLGGSKPARDMVVTDGQSLTLGDTTITLYITPGHTPGTISALIPVRDGGTSHLAALWGGTGLNADRESLDQYVASAQRFEAIARKANADVLLSNHTDWDGAKVYLPQLAARPAGVPNPFVVGTAAVSRYLTVARECATARRLRLN
jgi:metallo-beta-lactamase class B